MKKLLLFFMIILIFMAGCNENSPNNKTYEPNLTGVSDEIQVPLNTEGQLPEYFEPVFLLSIYQPANSSQEKYFNMLTWQEYIYDKFGFEINMFYNEKELKGAPAVYYFNFVPGFPYAQQNRVFDYINLGGAYDLGSYYTEYGWDKFVDSNYIEYLSDNGSIYAVPTAANKYIVPRFYNKEYLDALSMDVPVDIYEFRDYLVESKKIMQGEGIKFPMFVRKWNLFESTADIFRAFGVFINSDRTSTITYNPNTKSYEDAVFSENIEAALGFFRDLQDEELMGIYGEGHCWDGTADINPWVGDIFKVNKNFATEYNYVYDTKTNSFTKFLSARTGYETLNGYYLTHLNSTNVCEIRSEMGFYVFPKNIKNISGTVELFNSIMTDGKIYADLLYGIENTDYEIQNGEVFPIVPGYGTFPGIRTIIPVDDPNSYYTPNNLHSVFGLSKDLFFESNVFFEPTRFKDSGIFYSSGSYHDNLFLPCVSVSDAIKEYKKYFYNSGTYNVIEKLNENIGAMSNYDYTP